MFVVIELLLFYFFFFQAEDGIRDDLVTGVQTCALPISPRRRGAACRAATRRRGVRHLLAPAGQVSRAARLGTAVERGAQRYLPRPVSARQEHRARQRHRLARVAQQFLFALLSGGAGLRRLRQVLGLPQGRDVQQLRRPAPGAVRPQRPRDPVRGPYAGPGARVHLRRAAVPRAAARPDRGGGPLGRLRAAGDAARRGGSGAGIAVEDLARHRYRHSDRGERQENAAGGRVSGRAGGVSGRRPRGPPVAQVFRDEAREPRGRGARGARAGAGVTGGANAIGAAFAQAFGAPPPPPPPPPPPLPRPPA